MDGLKRSPVRGESYMEVVQLVRSDLITDPSEDRTLVIARFRTPCGSPTMRQGVADQKYLDLHFG
jgi:hypothetical protein